MSSLLSSITQRGPAGPPQQPIYPSIPGQPQSGQPGGQPHQGYSQYSQYQVGGPSQSSGQPPQAVAPWQQQQGQVQQPQQHQQPSYGQPQQQGQITAQSHQSGQVQQYSYGYGQQSQAVGSYGRPTYSYAPVQSTSLAPQQLESVGKDEDPVYGPLGRARSKVERALRGDEEISPDLADLVAAPCNEPYPALPGGQAFRPFRISRNTPLPDALHQELNFKHLPARMGLFEEIERAWFTVDNKLFLWDYSDGRDFSRYDEQPDTIVCVGLVKARKDVFVDTITHVLLICTTSRLTLLGLSHPSSREINLYHTQLTADLPTSIIAIHGTNAGRVFMVGANKDLYEVEYSNQAGWFFGSGAKVVVHNRSSGALSNWVPSVFSSSSKEGVESIAVDPVQDRLYTLHTKGEIECFDISSNRFESRSKYSRIRADLTSRGLAGSPPGYAGANIVAIAIVGGHESRRCGLVAITANGTRVYFNATFFQPLSYRPSPVQGLTVNSQTYYSSGALLSVSDDLSGPTPTAKLTVTIPHSGRQSAARENFENFELPVLAEWVVQEALPSQVWAIAETVTTNPALSPLSLRRSDGLALSSLPRQNTSTSREFLVLTTSGLLLATAPRPIDMLHGGLEAEKEQAINTARGTFGRVQLSAMGVTLGSTADMKQADLASAVGTILLSAGSPIVRETTAGRSIVYSGRHDGLALTIARLLRPIWSAKVTVPVQGRLVLAQGEKTLLEVQSRLQQLRQYVEDHPFPRVQAEGNAKLAWDQEELSLHGLSVLLKQAIEGISFLLLLNDYKLPDIVARCDPQTQTSLSNMTYERLLTSTEGRDVARRLVTSLIEQQIGQELGIDTLSEILQQRCGTFCQPGDVVMYKAEENMRRAEGTRDPSERASSLTESLRLFTRAAASMSTERLGEVAKRYRSLAYTPGAIELPLQCAAELDPNDKAGDYVRDGRHPGDPRKALHDARMECYACVVQALAGYDDALNEAEASGNTSSAVHKRDEAYAMAINSDDELFHYYLYDWLVARDLQEQLLDFETPYIEPYLRLTESSIPGRRDLIWKFFLRREDFMPASRALHDLATRDSDMSLNERIFYLAQALAAAKSASTDTGETDLEFTSGLVERCEVAQVQMEVLRALERETGVSDEEKKGVVWRLNKELLELDELYQNFARPYRLYEVILLILKTAETRIEDMCEAVWRQLLQTYRDMPPASAMADTITDLCRRFYPSEAAPIDIILPVVYSEALPVAVSSNEGWATRALLEGGVEIRDIWEVLVALHEQTDREDERDFYAEEAGVIVERWMESREIIPAAEVEQFASSYLLRAGGGGDERKMRTREKMQKAKQAVGRW